MELLTVNAFSVKSRDLFAGVSAWGKLPTSQHDGIETTAHDAREQGPFSSAIFVVRFESSRIDFN